VENIYEEIADDRSTDESPGSSAGGASSGGLRKHHQGAKSKHHGRRSDSENSSRKSSSMNSDSGISMSKPQMSTQKYSQGTLDVHPGSHGGGHKHGGASRGPPQHRQHSQQHHNEKLSALDSLLFRTAPGMTASQRRDLRKSLVDEVFEELIKRHHDRVLDQLKLDVEDFISPEGASSNNNAPPGGQNGNKLKKCESMDFKDLSKKDATKVSPEESATGLRAALKKIYSEAFNRKYFKSREVTSSTSDGASAPPNADRNSDRPPQQLPISEPEVRLPNADDICDHELDDEEDEGTERRLRRSQIIQSFLRQSDFSLDEEPEDKFEDSDESESRIPARKEPATITTRI